MQWALCSSSWTCSTSDLASDQSISFQLSSSSSHSSGEMDGRKKLVWFNCQNGVNILCGTHLLLGVNASRTLYFLLLWQLKCKTFLFFIAKLPTRPQLKANSSETHVHRKACFFFVDFSGRRLNFPFVFFFQILALFPFDDIQISGRSVVGVNFWDKPMGLKWRHQRKIVRAEAVLE